LETLISWLAGRFADEGGKVEALVTDSYERCALPTSPGALEVLR